MASIKFNFSKLQKIYVDAWERKDPTIAFEIRIGAGCFVFMMFLSKEDTDKNDRLFIYFRNIETLHQIKLYGYHLGGNFEAYISAKEEDLIRKELQLQGRGNPFNFNEFLNELNESIPQLLSPTMKGETLRNTWEYIKDDMRNIIDEADRTILIGLKRLPEKSRPNDKTLRKLYLYINGCDNDISDFIESIKERNITLAWTNDPTRTAKTFAQLLTDFSNMQ
ncbi:TPA: hypothetical protein PXM11_004024 [Yersinia enterocolitica]|uniref:Uncharacterized protein n=2 Tax=Yersinia enterocolitica TaxID=630 RepID=A0ABM9SHQ3_YEREN|nr:hypothetical protein [Yersinia enterocolitica]AOF17065.1 hypothetical protein BB936_21765 [Yersinia enterocolitica]CFV34833.1 Uncharacterised protein [Yersinia enterocolitica]CNE62873.1 Uncharacterised protein [Yersinia enterocolitica]CRX97581.1 Uncharacterised protein [Yersinia enterocolitica]HDL6968557.1 hypothetical protein [Yersinia enterocolitica]